MSHEYNEDLVLVLRVWCYSNPLGLEAAEEGWMQYEREKLKSLLHLILIQYRDTGQKSLQMKSIAPRQKISKLFIYVRKQNRKIRVAYISQRIRIHYEKENRTSFFFFAVF